MDFDIRKQRHQRGSSSSSVAEVKKRLNHVAVVTAEEGEGEGGIGRDEIRDSRRRDCDGERKRSLACRKE